MNKLVCRQVFVKGHVQGVGFRRAVLEEAKKIGELRGWVRNVVNGDVEIVVAGSKEKVERLIRWCHEGAGKFTRVDLIDERNVHPPDGLKPFTIRRV